MKNIKEAIDIVRKADLVVCVVSARCSQKGGGRAALAVGWSRGGASSGRAGRRRVAAGGPVAGGVFCRMLPCMVSIRGGMT